MLKSILKESSIYVFGALIIQIFGFISALILMKYLPIEEYGKYMYIIEFVAIFSFFADAGLSQYVIKEASQKPNQTTNIYFHAQSTQILISIIMYFTILLFSYFINDFYTFVLISIFGIGMVLNALFSPMFAILIASQRKDIIFYKDTLTSIIKLSYIYIGVYYSMNIEYFVLIPFINLFFNIVIMTFVKYKFSYNYFFTCYFNIQKSFTFIKQGTLFTLLMIMNILYNKIDIIMLEKMIGSQEVGYYAGATRFIYPFMFISGAFMTAVFPRMAKHYKNNTEFILTQKIALISLGILGFVISFSLFYFSDLIYTVFFGNKFNNSIEIFEILVWYLLIVFIYGPLSNGLVAQNKIKLLVIMNVLMFFVNIVFNYYLIPKHGAIGAAYSTIICEVVILMFLIFKAYNIYINNKSFALNNE